MIYREYFECLRGLFDAYPESMLLSLRNQKCKVFDDRVITCEFMKNANLISKMFKYNLPVEIPIKS